MIDTNFSYLARGIEPLPGYAIKPVMFSSTFFHGEYAFVDELIDYLRNERERIPQEHIENVICKFTHEAYATRIHVGYFRSETEHEYLERTFQYRKYAEIREADERARFAELKKKYEPDAK